MVGAGATLLVLNVALHALAALRVVWLARLLTPRDFGVIGIAQTLLVLLDALSNVSVHAALIRSPRPRPPLLDTAWTLEVCRGCVQAAGIVLLAPVLGGFVGSPEAVPITRAMALVPLLSGLLNPRVADLGRGLRVGRYCVLQLAASTAELVSSITLAVVLRSAWALVGGAIALVVVRVLNSYVLLPFRPALRLERDALRELVSFGRWTTLASASGWLVTSGVPIAIGRVAGLPALGVYSMAWRIGVIPLQEFGRAAAYVTLPAYTALRAEPARLASAFERVLALTAMLLAPALVWLFVVHDVLASAALGMEWNDVGPLLPVLGLAAAARVLTSVATPVLRSAGRTRIEALSGLLDAGCVALLLAILLPPLAVTGAGVAVLVGAALGATVSLVPAARSAGLQLSAVARAWLLPGLAAVAALLATWGLIASAPAWLGLVGSLLVAPTYLLSLVAFTRAWPAGRHAVVPILSLVRAVLRGERTSGPPW